MEATATYTEAEFASLYVRHCREVGIEPTIEGAFQDGRATLKAELGRALQHIALMQMSLEQLIEKQTQD